MTKCASVLEILYLNFMGNYAIDEWTLGSLFPSDILYNMCIFLESKVFFRFLKGSVL
jgi:hypothetical protein